MRYLPLLLVLLAACAAPAVKPDPVNRGTDSVYERPTIKVDTIAPGKVSIRFGEGLLTREALDSLTKLYGKADIYISAYSSGAPDTTFRIDTLDPLHLANKITWRERKRDTTWRNVVIGDP